MTIDTFTSDALEITPEFFTNAVSAVSGAQYYVASDASASGDGSLANPWQLVKLATPGLVPPGSTVYLRGGTYTGTWTFAQLGLPGAPIRIQNYPDEVVVLEQNVSQVDYNLTGVDNVQLTGNYQRLRSAASGHVIIQNIGSTRLLPGNGSQYRRPNGYNATGQGNVVINVLIFDVGNNNDAFPNVHGGGCRGLISVNNGWDNDALTRGQGHEIYLQNFSDVEKYCTGCMYLNGYSDQLHAYSSTGALNNIRIENCIVMQASAPSNEAQVRRPLVIDPDASLENVLVNNCFFYHRDDTSSRPYGNSCTQLDANGSPRGPILITATDVIGTFSADDQFAGGFTVTGCYVLGQFAPGDGNVVSYINSSDPHYGVLPNGSLNDETAFYAAHPGNTHVNTDVAAPTRSHVYPNADEYGRAHVAVFSPSQPDSVSVDVSSVCDVGADYLLYNGENPLALPIGHFHYVGGTVPMPMARKGAAVPPVGGAIKSNRVTGKRAGAFWIRKTPATSDQTLLAYSPTAWWDLSDTASLSLTRANVLKAITDKVSGRQLLASGSPVYNGGAYDAYPCVILDGVNDYLMCDALAPLIAGSDVPFTLIIVARWRVATGTRAMASFTSNLSTGGTTFHQTHYLVSNNFRAFRRDDVNVDGSNSTAVAADLTRTVLTEQFYGTTERFYRNSVRLGSGNPAAMNVGTFSPTNFTIGANRRGSTPTIDSYANFELADVLFKVGGWSDVDRAAIETYLMSKWRLV